MNNDDLDSIKNEPKEIDTKTNEKKFPNECCIEEINRLKENTDQVVQLILRKKADEIRILHNENKRLIENEKSLLEQIDALRDKLKWHEENFVIKNDASNNEVNYFIYVYNYSFTFFKIKLQLRHLHQQTYSIIKMKMM